MTYVAYKSAFFHEMQFWSHCYTVVSYQALFRLSVYKIPAVYLSGAKNVCFCTIGDFGSPTISFGEKLQKRRRFSSRDIIILRNLHTYSAIKNYFQTATLFSSSSVVNNLSTNHAHMCERSCKTVLIVLYEDPTASEISLTVCLRCFSRRHGRFYCLLSSPGHPFGLFKALFTLLNPSMPLEHCLFLCSLCFLSYL